MTDVHEPPVRLRSNAATVPAAERLVPAPVFVLSAPRSGSTLLRLILGTHPAVHAPHELHLAHLRVELPAGVPRLAMRMLGHDQAALEHLLWDRLLHLELARSGKALLVVKDPGNALIWERLAEAWPAARWVYLLRHPAAVLASWREATGHPDEPSAPHLARYMRAVDDARQAVPGLTIRYEDLATDPAAAVAAVCGHIGVDFQPGMLDYDRPAHLVRGVGDWSDTIRTGRVQPPRRPDGAAMPAVLADIAAAWGYR
ncbi:sulfotransferase family protein [Nonomuraea sp. NPDC003214]